MPVWMRAGCTAWSPTAARLSGNPGIGQTQGHAAGDFEEENDDQKAQQQTERRRIDDVEPFRISQSIAHQRRAQAKTDDRGQDDSPGVTRFDGAKRQDNANDKSVNQPENSEDDPILWLLHPSPRFCTRPKK